MGIEATGIQDMQASMQHLAEELRGKLVLRAVRDGARVILEAMREGAPVLAERNPGSDAIAPGTLRADMKISATVEDGMARAIVGPKHYAYVARWVEYGHRNVKGGRSYANGKGGWGGAGHEVGFVPAHEFLRPAFERTKGEALEAFRGSLQKYLPEGMR